MKERPILFSAPMVRALLAGTKTQTRRAVKPQPTHFMPPHGAPMRARHTGPSYAIAYQYGQPGDRLWVREAWWGPGGYDHFPPSQIPQTSKIEYVADGVGAIDVDGKLRRSIFMPRWASRITLEIVNVRVERLQDISEADCWAEGIHEVRSAGDDHGDLRGSVRQDYQALWESINGDGSWDENPWVWAVEFKRTGSE